MGSSSCVDSELERVRSELTKVRKTRRDESIKHSLEMEVLRMKVSDKKKAYQISLEENTGKRSPLHRYIEAARRARGAEAATPTYVLSLEGQLCRSMHHMLVLQADLNSYQESTAELNDWLRTFAKRVGDQKARIEGDVMDSIDSTRASISLMEKSFENKLRQQETAIKLLGGSQPSRTEPELIKTIDDSPITSDKKTPFPPFLGRQLPLIGHLWVNPVA